MSKKIDLPKNIKQGDKILVRETEWSDWEEMYYIGQFENGVYATNEIGYMADFYYEARMLNPKISEINWNEIPLGTKVRYWNYDFSSKYDGYLVAVIKNIPYCSNFDLNCFHLGRGEGNPLVRTYDCVELAEKK